MLHREERRHHGAAGQTQPTRGVGKHDVHCQLDAEVEGAAKRKLVLLKGKMGQGKFSQAVGEILSKQELATWSYERAARVYRHKILGLGI